MSTEGNSACTKKASQTCGWVLPAGTVLAKRHRDFSGFHSNSGVFFNSGVLAYSHSATLGKERIRSHCETAFRTRELLGLLDMQTGLAVLLGEMHG